MNTPPQKKTIIVMLRDYGLPLLILLIVTAGCRMTDLDMELQRHLYQTESGWVYEDFWLWQFLYNFGGLPGILMGLAGLLSLLAGFKIRRLWRYWRPGLFLFLLLAIGPGLLVNTVFKENWGRPRPTHVVEFGGEKQFLPVWQKGIAGEGNSFSSGHASIGFYTLAPFFLLRRRNSFKARLALAAGVTYGALMGAGRMAQGGHFFSDVVWSWGFVFLSGMILYYLLKPDEY